MPAGYYPRSEKTIAFLREISKRPRHTRVLKDKICSVCGKTFRPYSSLQKNCSAKCSYSNRPKKGIYKKCKTCGKEFYSLPTYINSSKYCSRECQHKGLIIKESKLTLKCKNCGKEYIRERSALRGRGSSFCSKPCKKEFQKTRQYINKKKGKTTSALLKKELWGLFSEFIRRRDGGVCISCGKEYFWRKTDAGHYIPKTAGLSLYFDERNVNAQCTYCNRWMHGNLAPYAIALRKKYGEAILEDLDRERHVVKKISIDEYKQLIEKYKIKLYNL